VSREIESVMTRCGRDNVWLDARHLGDTYLRRRFPTIWRACADAGYDLSADLVPVAPAAHYLVGGVRVDLDGRTTVPGLYASGEVAATGLHGANRLASNSLLEGLVFSRRIARALEAPHPVETPRVAVPRAEVAQRAALEPATTVSRLHGLSARHLGMSRSSSGLQTALDEIGQLAGVLDETTSASEIEALNLTTVAWLICLSARLRDESRGCHFRVDFPQRDDVRWRGHTVLQSGRQPRFEPLTPSIPEV
jgi:L-aspartate oxidase